MNDSQSLYIVFVVTADLPEGGGNTSRLKSLTAALAALGHKVEILVEHSLGNAPIEVLRPQGVFSGVEFTYVLGRVEKPEGIQFLTEKWKGTQAIIKYIKQRHRASPIDIVWFNQVAAHEIFPISRVAKKLGIKTIHSYEDERMKGAGLKRKAIAANQYIADKYLSRSADALVVISQYLKEKYQSYTGAKVPIFLVPTIIDTEHWEVGEESLGQEPRLLYAGSFFGFDEVEGVLQAVSQLKGQGISLQFDLLGYNRNQPEYMDYIASMIKELGLEDVAHLRGFIPFSQLPVYLGKANLLVGIRKDEGWSATGFSTKLSEYLATGRAVLCASVGDNAHYLTDGENAFMIESGATPDQIAAAIRKALADPEKRKRVGQEGKKTAIQKFDQHAVGKTLKSLLDLVTQK